jgi:hypothetical protein
MHVRYAKYSVAAATPSWFASERLVGSRWSSPRCNAATSLATGEADALLQCKQHVQTARSPTRPAVPTTCVSGGFSRAEKRAGDSERVVDAGSSRYLARLACRLGRCCVTRICWKASSWAATLRASSFLLYFFLFFFSLRRVRRRAAWRI